MKKKYYVKKKLKSGFHNIEGGHLLFLAITSISINILVRFLALVATMVTKVDHGN